MGSEFSEAEAGFFSVWRFTLEDNCCGEHIGGGIVELPEFVVSYGEILFVMARARIEVNCFLTSRMGVSLLNSVIVQAIVAGCILRFWF